MLGDGPVRRNPSFPGHRASHNAHLLYHAVWIYKSGKNASRVVGPLQKGNDVQTVAQGKSRTNKIWHQASPFQGPRLARCREPWKSENRSISCFAAYDWKSRHVGMAAFKSILGFFPSYYALPSANSFRISVGVEDKVFISWIRNIGFKTLANLDSFITTPASMLVVLNSFRKAEGNVPCVLYNEPDTAISQPHKSKTHILEKRILQKY